MGEKSISTQVRIDGNIVPDFSQDWEVEFQGEKYIMPLRIPQGAKENTSLNSTIDLTFQHWAIYQLKRWPFVTIQPIEAGTYIADEEVATVSLNLKDFCILFGQVLEYYYGGAITIDFNDDPVTGWQYKQEATIITISHTKIWNVLIDAFHDKYGVRWEIKPTAENSNTVKGGERYVVRVGYPTTEVDHIFEYGFEGGLLKVERQVQSEEIRNMLKGRGGETNIPFRYFKNTDPNNKDFRPDPDWVEELANIYFPNLMPATFRSYIQGWKAAHISKYPGYTAKGEANAYAPWAYRKGYTDTKFAPVEFVADEITISPTTQDKQVEILPGYSPYVKKGSSLDKYGPLPDTLDNNDDIYPTLQGTGLDIAVAVEQIESDDVAGSVENDAKGEDKAYPDIVKRNVAQGHTTAADASKRTYFSVPTEKNANIEGYAGAKAYNPQSHEDKSAFIAELNYTIKVFNAVTGAQHSASGIPAGNWYFIVEYSFNNTSPDTLNVTLSFNSVKITSATPEDKWRNTFDIWVKNVWDSAKLSSETDAQYSERVWKPVLGDREGNSAKVVFTSGELALSEDYEFTIVDFPVPDSSKSYDGEQSHWRIKLAKSDAELEATGKYIPNTQRQGKAGDTFVFVGTEMTHVPYVVDAEIRLDDWKKDQLVKVREIKPTAVVTTDRVRLNNEGKPDALINQLRVGDSLRLFDKRFFNEPGKAYETLYLQSITYAYREPTSDDAALNPDVEIVLGNEYTTSANPVSMMQGEISALQKQVGSISNIQQIVRAVGDKLYLRKDGISDCSLSPTQFFSLLSSGDFRAGLVGGAGWGFYKDENGNWVLEADRVNVRQEMQVNTLVINQAEGRGGMEIDTAAYINDVTRVIETDDSYVCYFDQKGGSVANLFHVDDVAYCNRWTPENAELKFYKCRVTAVSADSITLSKTDANGTGIPAEGDNIIHFGNYTDATRQYVKVRDVVGGGYEQYIEELNSVNAAGVEYFFIGRKLGVYNGKPRFFIGNLDGDYIEYVNNELNIKARLNVLSTVGDKPIGEYVSEAVTEAQGARIVLSAEVIGLECEADGSIIGTVPNVKASVFKGATELRDWNISGTPSGCAIVRLDLITAPPSPATFRVYNIVDDLATIDFTATKDDKTLTARCQLYKARPGADGEDAVLYTLEPSVQVVRRDYAGTATPNVVSCAKYKTVGSGGRVTTGENILKARVYNNGVAGAEQTVAGAGVQSGTVAVTADVTEIELSLYAAAGGALLARVRVPVVSDMDEYYPASDNLIVNSALNNGTRDWYMDAGVTRSEELTMDGDAVFKISANGLTADAWKGFQQGYKLFPECTQLIIPKGTKYLCASVWVYKNANIAFDRSTSMSVTVYDAAGTEVGQYYQDITPGAYGTWERKTRLVEIPEGGYSVRLYCMVVRNGELYCAHPQLHWGNALPEWSASKYDFNYVAQALKGTTTVSGGLALMSMIQLGEGSGDDFTARAGINGVVQGADNKDVAMWAGGTFDDALNKNATYTVYMDGTIRAADGTVEINASQMKILGKGGSYVTLDNNGLSLFNKDGVARLRVTNENLPLDASVGVDNSDELEWPKLANSLTIRFKYTMGMVTPSISRMESVTLVSSNKSTYQLPQAVTAKSVLQMDVTVPFNYNFTDSNAYVSGMVALKLFKNNTEVKAWKASFNKISKTSFEARFSINEILENGSYRLEVSVVPNTSVTYDASRTSQPTGTGKITYGLDNQNFLGNNGMLSTWGKSILCVREGDVYMRHGAYGIKVSDSGLQQWDNANSQWVSLLS